MKKMLAKAVALSLVMGGVGFVANNAQAADIGNGVKVHVEKHTGIVLAEPGLQTSLATQANLAKVDKVAEEAEEAKAAASENAKNITTNKDAIVANKNAIDKERTDRVAMDDSLKKSIDKERTDRVAMDNAEKAARVDADKKLNAKIDSNAAKVQEQLDAQDNKNKA